VTYWLKIAKKHTPHSLFGTFVRMIPCKFFDKSHLARKPVFTLLGTIPVCDGQTDGQTDRHVAISKTALCIAPQG